MLKETQRKKPVFTTSIIQSLKKYKSEKLIIVASEKFLKLHPDFANEILEEKLCLIPFPDGEKIKNFKGVTKLSNLLLEKQIDKKTVICAVGGGTLLDLCGFVSSILLRGLNWIAVPTTLLAMADASLGGKTAINTNYGKNLLGTYNFPIDIFVNIKFLQTLPKKQFQNGIIECLKCGIIKDKILFETCIDTDFFNLRTIEKIIKKTQSIKMEIVTKDPFEEKGERFLLNFGHTVGHSLERCFNYKILHGIAVAEGIVFESALSFLQGFLKLDDFIKIKKSINLLSSRLKTLPKVENIFENAIFDKKNLDKKVRYVPIKAIGKTALKPPYLSEVDFDTFKKAFFLLK